MSCPFLVPTVKCPLHKNTRLLHKHQAWCLSQDRIIDPAKREQII